MKVSEILTLFEYNYWANDRIVKQVAYLSEEQFIAPAPPNQTSIRGTLVHIMSAEWIWRTRTEEGISPASLIPETNFPSLSALMTHWEQEGQQMRFYLGKLSNEDLSQSITYSTTSNERQTQLLWQILLHVINHGTQHRSEVALHLTDMGYSPGDIDLITFLREQA